MAHLDLDALVAKLADRDGARTEADVQSNIKILFETGPFDLDSSQVRLETQATGQRRIDVEVGFTVVEVKKDLRPATIRKEAITQLAGYVADRTAVLEQRYVGILTDGADWLLYHLESDETLVEVARFEVRATTETAELTTWLGAVMATKAALTPTPTEVERRLGAASPTHSLDIATLTDLWERGADDSEVALKRELWARLLTTALGSSFENSNDLFLAHTYLVLIADVIAHEVIGIPTNGANPVSLVHGDRFTEAGVHGVVEADFFAWVLDVEGGPEFVRAVARRVSRFNWATVNHDVLKHLYESVIDAETRKNLGEYYTPDWLAEAVVESVVTEPLEQRAADPACGSGTFLFHAVRRYLHAATVAGIPTAQALDNVVLHVIGQDLHPVAVALARATYLLAIGGDRLMDGTRNAIHVPVHLGDSLQWQMDHSVLPQFGAGVTITIDDQAGMFIEELVFPESVMTDPAEFDSLVETLTRKATQRERGAVIPSITSLLKTRGVTGPDEQMLKATFSQLCKLHDERRNHIWGYYTRNLVRPMWMSRPEGKVDVLIGNPPWLAYRYMTAAMQVTFKTRCDERDLWVGQKVATQQDLSAYFVVRAAELYLKDHGRFGFVMPLATLSRQAFAPFRSGKLGKHRLAFDTAWDLDRVRPAPFPVPSAVIFGTNEGDSSDAVATAMPNTVEAWSGTVSGTSGTGWSDVKDSLTREVEPLTQIGADDGRRSPYGDRFRQGATIVPRVLHIVEPAPQVGNLGLAKGIERVRSARTSQEKKPWKNLATREATVESRFVYDLLLGSSIAPFRVLASEKCVIPWDGDRLLPQPPTNCSDGQT
jgi:hypothetical protein